MTREDVQQTRDCYAQMESKTAEVVVYLCDQLLELLPAAPPPKLPEGWKGPFDVRESRFPSAPSYFYVWHGGEASFISDAFTKQEADCIAYALNHVYPAKEKEERG